MQPALSSKNNKCLYKPKVIQYASLKFKISDVLFHKLKFNYEGVIESILFYIK